MFRNNMAQTSYKEFWLTHEPQLKSISFPPNLAEDLHERLKENTNVGCQRDFHIEKFQNSRPMLKTKRDLKKTQHFYIINHLWTSDGNLNAYKQLLKSPELVEKLATLMGLPPYVDPNISDTIVEQCKCLQNIKQLPFETIFDVLSKHEGDIITAAIELLDSAPNKEFKKVKKDNIKCSYEEFIEAMKASGGLPNPLNETHMKKMYDQFLNDKDGSGATTQYNWSDDGDVITVHVNIPNTARKHVIKSILSTNHWKLEVSGSELLNGALHSSVKVDESYWSIETPGVLCMTLEKVDDKTWKELLKGEELLSSANIMINFWLNKTSKDIFVNSILDLMWKFNQTYTVSSPDGTCKEPAWYVMDEYGSALMHSNDPNFKCSPFFNVLNGKTYSLMWPIKDISYNSVCTRNFIPQIIANETFDVSRVRLKAFIGKKILNTHANITDNKVNLENMEYPKIKQKKLNLEQDVSGMSVFVNCYPLDTIREKLSALKVDIITNMNIPANLNVWTMSDMSINVGGDILPVRDMILNKDYLNNYLIYQIDCYWLIQSYILPRDLVVFNKEFERLSVSQFWIVKSVDRRISQANPIVTSQYSRIVRLCEAGSVVVTKYFVDQPSFRNRRFVLSYTVSITSNRQIFIYTQPYVRLTSNQYHPNEFINEYDTSSTITISPEKENCSQNEDTFEDFKIVMNKLLLPRDPEKGWKTTEQLIYQRIGKLAKQLATDLCFDENRKAIVLFGVDVILDEKIDPKIVDVNVRGHLPNKQSLVEFLKLGLTGQTKNCVEVC